MTSGEPHIEHLRNVVDNMCKFILNKDFDALKYSCAIAQIQFELYDLDDPYVRLLKNRPLEVAIHAGQGDMLEYLIPHSFFDTTSALIQCLSCNNMDFLERLLPNYDSLVLAKALNAAAAHNRWDAVTCISKYLSAETSQYQDVVLWASRFKNQDAVEQYYTPQRAIKALERVYASWEDEYCDDEDLGEFAPEDMQLLLDHHQKYVLQGALQDLVQNDSHHSTERRKAKI